MAIVTADVVPSDDEEQPFKVVFMHGDKVIAEWLVDSQEEGEEELLEAIRELGESEDEDEDDDEEEDEDGDDTERNQR